MRRGAIVGFSFGAWTAGIVATVDARPKRAVLIAGASACSHQATQPSASKFTWGECQLVCVDLHGFDSWRAYAVMNRYTS
jgi:alpha/beta superfamily hydrolase